jgi:serine/threonine protein kinase
MVNEKAAPAISVDEFTRNLADSGLFDDADRLPDPGPAAKDGQSAAQALVAAGKLTRYQAEAILAGRVTELRLGNYEILDRLGSGGMGTVYKARHRRMKRMVALKVLTFNKKNEGLAEEFSQRFQREVETIARLQHPNIVMAFDADECEAGPFLVMELVNGRDLHTEVTIGGPMTVLDAADRILQAARGLSYAHEQGIVHRDIKPGNLLRDETGVVKVADLGLARLNASAKESVVNTALTQAGDVLGTVDYMPPEQAMDSSTIDLRADIYSLGCAFYFLLTGRPPYSAGSMLALMLKHRDDPIPSLHDARNDIPPELESIFRRMVAKNLADRYQSMAEVVQALEELIRTLRSGAAQPALTSSPTASPAPAARTDQTVVLGKDAASSAPDTTSFHKSESSTGLFEAKAKAGWVAPRCVVLVETSRTQAGIIRRYLQQLGIAAVHTTGAGTEALELAKRENASVIISSMHLTDMTGVKLARALLDDPGCSRIGFVLATSEADTAETEAVPASPRIVLMLKPFDLTRLKESIATVVDRESRDSVVPHRHRGDGRCRPCSG